MSFIRSISRIKARFPTIPAIDDSPVPLWPRLVTQVVLLLSLSAVGWFIFQRLQALDDRSMNLDFHPVPGSIQHHWDLPFQVLPGVGIPPRLGVRHHRWNCAFVKISYAHDDLHRPRAPAVWYSRAVSHARDYRRK